MCEVISLRTKQVCGLDLGDRTSTVCVTLDGEVVERCRVRTTEESLARRFRGVEPMRIALEAGAQSPWVSRLLAAWGHEVLVAQPRKVRLIGNSRRKSDRSDAQNLADLASVRPRLLSPIEHLGAEAQADRAVLRARDSLVRTRSSLISHARGLVKAQGGRLPSCAAEVFAKKAAVAVPAELRPALVGVLECIARLSEQIRDYDRQVQTLLTKRYPQSRWLLQVSGVGPLTTLAFLLAVGDPKRFAKSRSVGAFFGLVPAQRSSGQSDPQLRISKEGDPYVRRLLVQCAHYQLGHFGKDCDLRRFGEHLAARGGKAAKKRACVAVARKLSVLLHRLLVSQQLYEPLRTAPGQTKRKAVAA